MDTDRKYEELFEEIRRMRQLGDELLDIHTNMLLYQSRINMFWISSEVDGINELLEKLMSKIRWTADELYGIGHDMIMSYERISKE